MSEKIRKLKENASRLIAKGKLAEAADEYVKIVKTDPRDLTARQKLAEIYARMGKVQEAVVEYQSVAGSYAADGLLLKAIAVCKIILQVDPSHTETQHILAELSTRRRGESAGVEMPKSMSSALAPGAKRSAHDIRGVPSSQLVPHNPNAAVPVGQRPTTHVPAAQVPLQPPPPRVDAAAGMRVIELGVGPQTPSLDLASAAARAATFAEQRPAGERVVDLSSDDIDVDVSFDSSEGAPVVVGVMPETMPPSTPIEMTPIVFGTGEDGASLPSLPPDMAEAAPEGADAEMLAALRGFDQAQQPEISLDDSSDIIELTEAARIDVDKVPPIPLFSDLPKDAFIALTERMELRVAAVDDVLVQEGEPGTSMFIIIQGRVSVKRKELDSVTVGRGDLILAELTDGAFFGEMALLSDAPRMASVVCADDTMLFEISRELLADITREYPSVGEVMKRFHKNRLLTNLLKTSPIFQPFSTRDKKDLIEKFKSRSVDEGTYLITRERPGEGLYVVLSGRCEVLDNTDDKEVLLAELKEGDVFGEMSMLWHKKTCASVKATTPCVVLRLPRESFNEVIMTHPQILETLTALSERRQKQNQELKAPEVVTDFLV